MLKYAEDLKGKKTAIWTSASTPAWVCCGLWHVLMFQIASFITNVSQCPTSCHTFCIWISVHVYTECWRLCFSKEYWLKQVFKGETNTLNRKSASELWLNSSKRNSGELELVIKSKAVKYKLKCEQKLNYLVRKMVNCVDKKTQILKILPKASEK